MKKQWPSTGDKWQQMSGKDSLIGMVVADVVQCEEWLGLGVVGKNGLCVCLDSEIHGYVEPRWIDATAVPSDARSIWPNSPSL
ncbi:MAG: hypothetical protein AAF823_16155 [Planctomycetota bacterium]